MIQSTIKNDWYGMNISYKKTAQKSAIKLDKNMRIRIKDAIELLPEGDVKKLKTYTNLFRLRVGDYRIIYELFSSESIIICDILPRGSAYKDL